MENFNFLYQSTLNDQHMIIVALTLVGAFAALYFVMATSFHMVVKQMVKNNFLKLIIDKPLFPQQLKFEMLNSIWSIIIFGLYGTLIVFLFRLDFLQLRFSGGVMVIVDLAILAIWNEVHFFLGHRLMHTKPLMKFHRTHHKSVVVTPFSTYSFHPIESIIMGSVMIIPMLFYSFEIWSLIIFPVYHLFFNTIGHTNVQLVKAGKQSSSISSRHNNHHTKFSVNYGFVSTLTDRLASILNKK